VTLNFYVKGHSRSLETEHWVDHTRLTISRVI